MSLSPSPQIWQTFINAILCEIVDKGDHDPEIAEYKDTSDTIVHDTPQKKHHLVFMDDCLVHSRLKDHLYYVMQLFKAFIKHGLKLSPKKLQLFRKCLTYMGHTLKILGKTPYITPLKSRVDAILKQNPPKSVKECRQFCGMVNFLSFFLDKLQIILQPIYYLTRKLVPYLWGPEQQKAFEMIKELLTKPPVLLIPNTKDPFILYSDTCKTSCGAALYQVQNGRDRIVAYHSKKLPDAVARYSISDLEVTGMVANIAAFNHLLSKTDFTVYVDHSALVHILKAKKQPPTLRLRKVIEDLSDYSFVVKYHKGKDMHVANFLSRHTENDTDDPGEIIPISFVAQDLFLYLLDENTVEHDIFSTITDDNHDCDLCLHYREFEMFKDEFFSTIADCEQEYDLCDIYREFEKFMVLTRGMTTKENVQVPPIKYSTKRPEHSGQTVIDINVKNPLPSLPVPDVSQIPHQPIEPLVPIPAKKQKRKAKNRTKQRAHTNVPVPPPINDIPDIEHIEKDD